MQINNPIQMNDWEIKKFLKVILSIQFAIWGAIGLDVIGLQIPIMRQLIGFIYLIFVPGIIILRILKLHKLGNIETLLYAVGLSIATLMFMGLFMNTVYPFFGISGPISSTPLIITISAVVLGLCCISYKRDKDFCDPRFIEIKDIVSPPTLFLCLIPFLAIFGTYLVNFHHNNILLMFLIIILALIVVLVGFDKFIPKKLYPFAVFIIAISLLFHRSLISSYVWGWDIHLEYYLCNLVKMNAVWDSAIPMSYNAMLSIVMVAPIFSNICKMALTGVFKIIYPLIFALVPLGLYQVFQKQTNDKIAFFSCFFFMSVFVFYTEMLALARQQIAEFFLVLLMLLMVNKNMDGMKKAGLLITFAFSLVVSHYGLSYLFMFSLIVIWGMFFLNKWHKNQDVVIGTISTSKFIVLYITFALTWYMCVSSSSAFNEIVRVGVHITSNIFTDFLNPEAVQGISIIMKETVSPLHSVTKYIHLITQFFIAIGIFTSLLKHNETKFEKEYAAFSYVNFMICFAGIAIPFFASSLNTTRLYQITLIFLAPFCVVGGVTFFRMLDHVVKKSWTDQIVRSSLKLLSVFFAIFLLFNSGWVYEVTKDHPGSVPLSQNWIKEYGDAKTKIGFYGGYDPEQNIISITWLSKMANKEDIKIYAGKTHPTQIVGYAMIPLNCVRELDNVSKIDHGAYVYLGYLNVVEGIVEGWGTEFFKEPFYYDTTEIISILNTTNKIYSNGGSEVYYEGD